MNTTLLLTQLGFVAITIVYYGLFLAQLRRSLKATNFPEERKKRILTGTTLALISWAGISGVLSLSGFLRDFSLLASEIYDCFNRSLNRNYLDGQYKNY